MLLSVPLAPSFVFAKQPIQTWAPGTLETSPSINALRSAGVKYLRCGLLRNSPTIAVLTAHRATQSCDERSRATQRLFTAIGIIMGVMMGRTFASRSLIHPLLHTRHGMRTCASTP